MCQGDDHAVCTENRIYHIVYSQPSSLKEFLVYLQLVGFIVSCYGFQPDIFVFTIDGGGKKIFDISF